MNTSMRLAVNLLAIRDRAILAAMQCDRSILAPEIIQPTLEAMERSLDDAFHLCASLESPYDVIATDIRRSCATDA